jgi:hypothetical protein
MTKNISILICCILTTCCLVAQKDILINKNLNNKEGTIVIRKIERNPILSDKSLLIARLLTINGRIIKQRLDGYKPLTIDTISYEMGGTDKFEIALTAGFHVIGINAGENATHIPFSKRRFRFKKKRVYHIDIYTTNPQYPYH